MSHGPIFTQKLIYQAHSEPVSTSPETVTEDRWHQPWSEPVRQKIKPALAIALIASGLSWDPQPIPTQSDAWRQPLSEPTRKREDKIALRVRYPFIYGSVYMSWFGPLPEPVRTKIDPRLSIALIASGSSWNPQPIAPPVQNIDKWQQPLSEPVRKKENRIGLRDRYPFVASAVHIGWFGSLSEPIRIRTTLQAGLNPSIFYTPQPDPADDLSAAWIVKFTDPVRIKQGLNAANQQAAVFYPFPFPPVTATIGWFNNLSDPIRRIRMAPIDQQFTQYQPIIPSFGWYNSFSDPIRRIRIAAFFDHQILPTPEISFGWFNNLSDPARIQPGLKVNLQPYFQYQPFPISASYDFSWFNNLSEPARRKAIPTRYEQQSWSLFVEPTFISFGWFGSLSEPTRRVRPTPTDQQFLPYSPIIPSYGWYVSLTDPTRRIRPTSTDQQFTQYQPIIPSFGWYGGLTDPVRKPRIASFDPQNFVFQVTPAVVSFGWFGSLSEPPRIKRTIISDQTFLDPLPRVSFGWFGGLSEPVRKKPRVAWTDHVSFQFPIVPFSWFNRLNEPTLPKSRVIAPPYFSFSPNPIQLSFGWYGNLTEPVRKKPKVWEGIFEARPYPIVITNYLASLAATEQRDFLLGILYQFNPPLRAYVDIIENDPKHRGNLGIIEPAPEPSIIASIVPQSASVTGGTPVPTVAGARVAIITG